MNQCSWLYLIIMMRWSRRSENDRTNIQQSFYPTNDLWFSFSTCLPFSARAPLTAFSCSTLNWIRDWRQHQWHHDETTATDRDRACNKNQRHIYDEAYPDDLKPSQKYKINYTCCWRSGFRAFRTQTRVWFNIVIKLFRPFQTLFSLAFPSHIIKELIATGRSYSNFTPSAF